MSTTWQADDTAVNAPFGAYCDNSGDTNATTTASTEAETTGVATATTQTVSLASGTTSKLSINFELPVPAGTTWGAGTWTVNINVTTAANRAGTAIKRCDICRVNSSNVNQATIASATGLTIAVDSTGQKVITVSGGTAQTPSTGDKVLIIVESANGSATKTTSWTYDHSASTNIVGPFTVAAAGSLREQATHVMGPPLF